MASACRRRYCVVDAASVGLELLPGRGKDVVRLGEMIKVCNSEA
jgi:hypothetical protein